MPNVRRRPDLTVCAAIVRRMAIENGSRVYLIAGGVSVFEVLEVGAGGDPAKALVQAVAEPDAEGNQPAGVYPFATDIARLVQADS